MIDYLTPYLIGWTLGFCAGFLICHDLFVNKNQKENKR